VKYQLWLHTTKDEYQLYKPEYEPESFVHIGEIEADSTIEAEQLVEEFLIDPDYVNELRETYG